MAGERFSENGESVEEVAKRLEILLAAIEDHPVKKSVVEGKREGIVQVLKGGADQTSFEYYSRKSGQHIGPTQTAEDQILQAVERVLYPRFLKVEVNHPPAGIDGDYLTTNRYRTVFSDVWLRETKRGFSKLVKDGVGKDVSWEITR